MRIVTDGFEKDIPLLKSLANYIGLLEAENHKLAGLLMHEYVFVHERIIAEVDEALKPYIGRQ